MKCNLAAIRQQLGGRIRLFAKGLSGEEPAQRCGAALSRNIVPAGMNSIATTGDYPQHRWG